MKMAIADHPSRPARSIGASDVSKICGESEYGGAMGVYKRCIAGEWDARASSPHLEWGKMVENAILDMCEKDLGVSPIIRGKTAKHKKNDWGYASPDGVHVDENDCEIIDFMVDAKNVNWQKAWQWKSGEFPREYLLQLHWQMFVVNSHMPHKKRLDKAHIYAQIASSPPELRICRYDKKLMKLVIEVVDDFWHEHVLKEVPPAPDKTTEYKREIGKLTVGSERVAKKEYIDAGEEETRYIQLYLEQKNYLRELQSEVNYFENQIVQAIGDAYGIKSELGTYSFAEVAGSVSWAKVAKDLRARLRMGEKRWEKLLDKNRGESYRRGVFYPKKGV